VSFPNMFVTIAY